MRSSPSPASSSSPPPVERRHLRVGIIQGKRIVEERVLRAAETITLGPTANDTFILPPDVLARPWRLFEERRGRLVLRLGPEMRARLAEGAASSAFEAAPGEPVRAIVLPEAARGKVTVGDTTVLFQRVRPPAPRPRPQLPASVRRHVLADLDAQFVLLAALTFLSHLALVVYLRRVDWPRKPVIDELPDRFLRDYPRRPKPPAPTPAPTAPAPVAVRPKPSPRPAGPVVARPTRPVESAAERHARLDDAVSKMGLLALIGAKVPGGASYARDVLGSGTPDQSVEEALKNAGGVTVASADALRLPRVGGAGRIATPTGLRGAGPISDAARVGPAIERGVRTDVHEGAPVVEGGKVDAPAIAREIRGRRKAIAACYERALKAQPTLAGKLVVRFSLAAAGTVTAVEIDDDTLGAPEVGACVRAVVLRWRFPALAEGAAELSFPFVFQPGG
ncbi:MAG TPA: AgmX/PglI C-terminal domain-containing protein [Polyangia bacterium]|nr:AgmX/PglI C-terminal domain-containing protein [Polyangia bacterium]